MLPQDTCWRSGLDYAGHGPIREARRRRCSLNSLIPAPGRLGRSASIVATPSIVRRVRLRPGAERDCRSHRDARRAASCGGKSGTPASRMRCAMATYDARGRSPSVHPIRVSASTRRSAPVVCVPFASRSSRASTARFSVASASTRETAADERLRGVILMHEVSRPQPARALMLFPSPSALGRVPGALWAWWRLG
jgi:hypothetical protein